MLEAVPSSKFRKDVRKLNKSGLVDMGELKNVIETLMKQKPLNVKYSDHPLNGVWNGYRDCHVHPDVVLIYKVVEDKNQLYLARLGSHSNLFKM